MRFQLALTVLVFALSSANCAEPSIDASPDEFEKLSKQPDTVMIDVRTPKEFRAGHIKGTLHINIFDDDFEKRIKALDNKKTYLVYCASGGRSADACEQMQKLGLKNLRNLSGGIRAWQAANKPVDKGD